MNDDEKADECIGAICGALAPLLVPPPPPMRVYLGDIEYDIQDDGSFLAGIGDKVQR